MKKIYLNPELEVVKIATIQMLAASDGHVDVDDESPISSGDDIGARGSDFDEEY